MLEKLIWIAAFMLVGARHPGATVGVVEKDYRSEVIAFPKPFFNAAFFHMLLYYVTFLVFIDYMRHKNVVYLSPKRS